MLAVGRWWMTAVVIVAMLVGPCVNAPRAALAAEAGVVIPAPLLDNPKAAASVQTAVLSGGCFWGVQAVYQHVRGVQKVLSGYQDFLIKNPTHPYIVFNDLPKIENLKKVFPARYRERPVSAERSN